MTTTTKLDLTAFTLGRMQTNCYLLATAGRAVAIDAGEDPTPVLDHLTSAGLRLERVLLTHLHADHAAGAARLQSATGAEILASPDDAWLAGQRLWPDAPPVPPFDFTPIGEGPLTVLDRTCQVLATPGHTPGSLSFHFPSEGIVFTGDLIFRLNVGRCDLQGGDAQALKRSIHAKIFTLPLLTVIHPGHGPETTVRIERTFSPFVGALADPATD